LYVSVVVSVLNDTDASVVVDGATEAVWVLSDTAVNVVVEGRMEVTTTVEVAVVVFVVAT
jgi:hypothetical protein